METLKQLALLFAVYLLAVWIGDWLPFAFPASVIAMLLLLICLLAGILKVEHIREKSDFLLANMAFFFIPAGVNVINYLDILRASWLSLLVICLVTMVITFAATALSIRLTVQLLHKKEGGRKHE